MRIETDIKLDFKDVLIRPKRSTLNSRSEVSVLRQYKFKYSPLVWEGVPVIAANMDHTGTFDVAKVMASHQLMTAMHKFVTLNDWVNYQKTSPETLPHCFVSIGTSQEDLTAAKEAFKVINSAFICLDVANGYTQHFVSFLRQLRDTFPDKVIMAGNVVTGEMAEELLISGADIVKIGIGPGSVCTTRYKTGVGYPQLSAIIECADAAHGLKGLVCADGGCTCPGDVAKAFAAGADFVMLGGMLAGHDECGGEVIEKGGKPFKAFYGMSSKQAMTTYYGSVADYRASEGRLVHVPYRGALENTVLDILGGLRSACTYVGAKQLKELTKRTTFVRVSQQLNEVYSHYQVGEEK
ncbi:MAG: GMP reductase [Gammaproteobacteria bacterium]|nr:GMP reductase [Gammaproteobacteria bacterium]MCD8542137.1 GMP reductase [Gammaproteobacteria bacterium]